MSPAGDAMAKAASELARRIKDFVSGGSQDPDADYLAKRFIADLGCWGLRFIEPQPQGTAIDPFRRKAGTSRVHEHAAAIRANLPQPGAVRQPEPPREPEEGEMRW